MAGISWIKLRIDMFDDEKIKIIQSMPEGDALLVIWIRLIALAGKCNANGLVLVEDEFPYSDEMLSVIFAKPLSTVRLALKTFEKFRMIETTQKGIYITNFDKHQNVEGMDRIREQNRVRKQRERDRKKALRLEELSSGHKVGVMSDAGYPVISDPGQNLVRAATEKNWPVISFSGPNAAINALVASGLDARHYLFYGFLDAKSGKRKKELEELRTVPWTLVFYEAPHRIVDTLEDMVEVFGDRPACLARELTKKFEEYLRGTLQELLSAAGDGLKGEMVLVVAGCEPEQVSTEAAITRVMALTAQGMKQKAAAKQVAAETGLSANELYRLVLQRPKPGEEDTEIPNR